MARLILRSIGYTLAAIFLTFSLTALAASTIVNVSAQQEQIPKLEDLETVTINVGTTYVCLGCEQVFQGSEFSVWEYDGGRRINVIEGTITDEKTYLNEGFVYNLCFSGSTPLDMQATMCNEERYEVYEGTN